MGDRNFEIKSNRNPKFWVMEFRFLVAFLFENVPSATMVGKKMQIAYLICGLVPSADKFQSGGLGDKRTDRCERNARHFESGYSTGLIRLK